MRLGSPVLCQPRRLKYAYATFAYLLPRALFRRPKCRLMRSTALLTSRSLSNARAAPFQTEEERSAAASSYEHVHGGRRFLACACARTKDGSAKNPVCVLFPCPFLYRGSRGTFSFPLPFSSMRLLTTRSLLTTLVSFSFSPFVLCFVCVLFSLRHTPRKCQDKKKPPGETARRHEKSPSGEAPEGPKTNLTQQENRNLSVCYVFHHNRKTECVFYISDGISWLTWQGKKCYHMRHEKTNDRLSK